MPDPDPANDFDSIIERLSAPGGGSASSSDPMLTMMMMQMQNDRADRAASRQMMLQLATSVLPAVLPLLLKKEADPLVMTLLQSTMAKNNDGEQLKQMLQMMAAANQMTMDQLKSSLLSIMEMKDQQTKKMLEERGEGDEEPKSGPAAIMQEIRLGLGMLAGVAANSSPAPAALPQPQGAAPAASNPGKPRQPPVVVLLHQMRGIQTKEITGNLGAAWAAMATIALQDPKLIEAIDSGDIQQVVAYCQPVIMADQKLLEWVTSKPEVAAWIDKMVTNKLIPLIDVARDDGEEDGKDDGEGEGEGDDKEPPELNQANLGGE